jgi:signal transduction histidine kinase
MALSIKQKQVLGVTSIVVLVVVGLSVRQLVSLTRMLVQQRSALAETIALTMFGRAREIVTSKETGHQELRRDVVLRELATQAQAYADLAYAAITDVDGTIVMHSDVARIGERLPPGDDLALFADAGGFAQLRAIYQTDRMLELRQPMMLEGGAGDDALPFAEIRVGFSPLLIRRTLTDELRPAAVAAGISLLIAVVVAMILAQVVVRPIHVIRSGLSRLGQGDFGAKLDLKGDEFKDLGDVFASVTNQLKAVIPDSAKRAQLMELSRRVASLGRLTAGVAHEVKNPLNAMTIHLELLRQKLSAGADEQSTEQHVDIISREIRRLDDVVQGFLKFARPEELTLRRVPPGELIEEVMKTLEVEANVTGVSLARDVAAGVPDIEADPGILRQALLNLAKNAVQAMPDGGRLTMSAAPTKDGRVEIRVADTGVGIPPENLAKIFDLYFTTKQTGTGIGLSLVYRTIQLHNGDIDVESTPGVGTTFVIKMPKAGPSTGSDVVTPSLRTESRRLRASS